MHRLTRPALTALLVGGMVILLVGASLWKSPVRRSPNASLVGVPEPRPAGISMGGLGLIPVSDRGAATGGGSMDTAAGQPEGLRVRGGGDDAIRGFDEWLGRWMEEVAAGGDGSSLKEMGLAWARRRREVLKELIETNPRAALASALPWSKRLELPAEILQELEQHVAGVGDWEVLCVWRMPGRPGKGAPYLRQFTVGGRVYQAFVSGRRESQGSVKELAVHGIAVDDRLAVAEMPLRVLEDEEAEDARRGGRVGGDGVCAVTGRPASVVAEYGNNLLALADRGVAEDLNRKLAAVEPGFRRVTDPPMFSQWTHGVKRLLFMRVRFPDDVREPISEADAADVMRLANEYFVTASYNNLALISTIGPLVSLPQPKLYYAVRGPGALLADARVATRAAGYEPDTFDLDMVRFENVPGFEWGGLGSVGRKGVWLQSSGLGVICHELGHNLGLAHANFWNTVRPEPPDNPQNLPFDADSLTGIDSVLGPGDDVEYGDPFDVMGSGGGLSAHFNGLHKYLLGWIPEASIQTVTTSGVYRVYAHDTGMLGPGAAQVLRVRKDAERMYWIDARGARTDNPWLSSGVELHWNNWHQAIGSSEILDTTPGTRHGKEDAPLTLGRMFSDEAARVHITVIGRGTADWGGTRVPYYDVAIRMGPEASNTLPELAMEVSTEEVGIGEAIVVSAQATDSDGDALAYAWDLGDGAPNENLASVTHAWGQAGDYVVRCEVSDGRGGRAARHKVIRVGGVGGLRIHGRVVDQAGTPLLGVRVHNGMAGTNGPHAPEYRWSVTDSDGRYTLVGLQAGSYEVGGVRAGYDIRPLNFSRPLVLNQFTGVEVDFIAAALPNVRVSPIEDGDEALGRSARVEIARSGNTNASLRVYFRTAGTAVADEDYEAWKSTEVQTNVIPTVLDPVSQELTYGYVDLNPGQVATQLTFPVLEDEEAEGDESLVVTLHYPVTRTVASETETNIFDIPGWEVLADNGRDAWFQTRPRYQLGALEEATVRLRDASPRPETRLAIVPLETEVSENAGDTASFLVVRTGRAPTESLFVPLQVSGTAMAGDDYVPLPAFLRIPAEVEAVRLTVEVLEDRFIEGTETVTVTLGQGPGYVVGGRTASVNVVDNDLPWVSVTVVDPVIPENGSTGRITFQRSGDLSAPLELDYLLGGSAASGVDYASLPGRVVVPAGSATVTIEVSPLDDDQLEGDETVEIHVGDSPVYNVVQPGRGTLTIRDDEYPTVTVEAVDADAVEGNDDPGVWILRRTGSTAEALQVRYRFGGSAQHQVDFIAIGDRIVIPAGQTQVRLTAIPIDDVFREDPETIAIELMDGPGYGLGTSSRAGVNLLDNDDAALAVGFAVLASLGPESKTDPELAVRISGNPDEGPENAVTVAWEVLGGTATLGADYVVTNGTLTFEYEDPEGETPLANRMATIPLQILDDSLVETDETFLIRLRIAPTELPSDDPEAPPTLVTNGFLDVFSVHTYTIVDDDASEISVATVQGLAVEGGAEAGIFEIRRTGRTNLSQTVTFDLSGLAAAGSDYVDVPRSVTLLPGQGAVQVMIVAVDDPLEEYRENVRMTLVSAPGARLARTRFSDLQIEDNDGTIEFAQARWEVLEGAGEAKVVIRRTGDSLLAATVQFETSGGTAEPVVGLGETGGGDYWRTNGVLTFAPGIQHQEIRIRLRDDHEIEDRETVLMTVSRGTGLFPLGGQNRATLTIVDDDARIGVGTNLTAGIESEAELVVRLERTGPVEEPLIVDYETRDHTAEGDRDYGSATGSIMFAAGEREAVLRIPLIDDRDLEENEVFLIVFYAMDGSWVGDVAATIVEDDCRVEFEVSSAEVDENSGVLDLVVRRVGSALNPVKMDFEAISGTALVGEDFVRTTGTLEFAGNRFEALTNGTGGLIFREGETNRVLSVGIVNDRDGERDEEFEVRLTNVRSGLAGISDGFVDSGTRTNLVVTIRDNEAPGRVDDAFHPGLGADAPVHAIAIQADGKILVGGEFGTFDGVVLPRLARLHADGFVDQSFHVGRGFDGTVLAVGEIEDGRLLVGGTFSRLDGDSAEYLVRLEPDGTRSSEGQLIVDGPVRSIVTGKASYVGGDFSRVGGQIRSGVARLVGGSQVDLSFTPEGSGVQQVRALAPTPEGGVWVGGGFQNWAGSGRRYLVRLDVNGRVERTIPVEWLPNGVVHTLVTGPEGSLYVGGEFSRLGGLPRSGVARWLAVGGVDPGFDPGSGANGAVLTAALGTEGRAVVGGAFDFFSDNPSGRFARLNSDGSLDDAFFRGAGANATVRSIVVQPNGAILLGGDFTEVNGMPRSRIARIHAEEAYEQDVVEFEKPEWVGGEGQGEVEIRVVRVGSAKVEARVAYRGEARTAGIGVDLEAFAGELVFAPGQAVATFRVRLLDDSLAEGSESVRLILEHPVATELGRRSVAELRIEDDETALGWDQVEAEVLETEGRVRMVVRRSGLAEGDVRVRLTTQGLTASEGSDFIAADSEVYLPPGAREAEVWVGIVDDDRVEGREDFEVALVGSDPVLPLGSQSVVRVVVHDNDRLPSEYPLTLQTSPGGVVTPGSGRYPTNALVTIEAVADHGFEFIRWEGTTLSTDNPLVLRMDRPQVLTARFRARLYLETFESGGLGLLPWQMDERSPWRLVNETASTGQWSLRSGVAKHESASVLVLEWECPAGGGSFDFRTQTEADWDFLEFWVDGERRERWSGVNGWQTYVFRLTGGRHRLEWRWVRDRTFGADSDAVWLDNLDLPEGAVETEPPRLKWVGRAGVCAVEVTANPGRNYILEASRDLRNWQVVGSRVSGESAVVIEDPGCGLEAARYYRVRVE